MIDEYLNKIICADSLDIMRRLPDKCVDLVLTDPPYGAGKDICNDNLEDDELLRYLKQFGCELKRICKYNLIVDSPKDKIPLFIKAFEDFKYEYLIVLHETNGMRNGKIGFNNCGIALWFTNEYRKINRYKDVISEPLVNTKDEFKHPCPKNIKHYKQLVKMFGNEGDLILDPFGGSGTTAIAALELGMNYIVIEKEPKYCEIANRRVQEWKRQLKLW